MKHLIVGLTAALIASQALAQVPISGLPPASTPLTGAEVFPLVQGGVTKQATIGTLYAPTANRDLYVSTVGNDGNNGAQWSAAKLTLQAAVTAASGAGQVHVGYGTYTLASPLLMQPGVALVCVPGAVITQASGANLSTLIDFATNSANGASIQGCIIDGNRSGNTDNASPILVNIGAANDVSVSQNTIKNGSGAALAVTTGLRPSITNNAFSNFYIGVVFITGAGSTATQAQIVGNTISGAIGQHAISVTKSDYNVIQRNRVNAFLQKGMVVNVAGTAVTWVSGPTFSTLNPGEFLILNGGDEKSILSINSATSLTLTSSDGTLSGVPAASGPGDLIGVTSASYTTIAENTVSGGVSGSLVVSNFIAGESTVRTNVVGNILGGVGGSCVSVQSVNTYSTIVRDTQIVGNQLWNCGLASTAAAASGLVGVYLVDFSGGTMLDTVVTSNSIADDQGTPTTAYWMRASGMNDGSVLVRGNANSGTTNNGVAAGIRAVTLSAGWGTTATSTSTSYGDSFVVNVASSGTGQLANPTIVVNGPVTPTGNPPVAACQDISNLTTHAFVYNQNPGAFTLPGGQFIQWNSTPLAGTTYTFLCRG